MKPLYACVIVCLLLAQSFKASAQWSQLGPILYDTSASGFGSQGQATTVSADGNTLIVGCPFNNNQAGGFFVFRKTGGQWVQQAMINGDAGDYLGSSLGVSRDGNTVVATGNSYNDYFKVYTFTNNAWQLQFKGPGFGYPYEERNVALSYDGNTVVFGNQIWVRVNGYWNLQSTLHANDASFGAFSHSVTNSLSADGNTVAIGEFESGTSSDDVWVFVRNGNSWSQQGPKLIGIHDSAMASVNTSGFGRVALSGDGNTLAFQTSLGDYTYFYVWIFNRVGTTWLEQDQGNFAYHQGQGVALSYNGNELVQCAQTATAGFFYYSRSGSNWAYNGFYTVNNAVLTSTQLGFLPWEQSVSIDSAGANMYAGNAVYEEYEFSDEGVGGVWQYAYNGSSWAQTGNDIYGQGVQGSAGEGSAIAISANGQIMAMAAPEDGGGEGKVFTYRWGGSNWLPLGNPLTVRDSVYRERLFGNSLALSSDGSTLAVGSPNAAANAGSNVYVYTLAGNQYVQQGDSITAGSNNYFGNQVALSYDGNTLLVGTGYNGAYVFTRSGNTWSQQQYFDSAGAVEFGHVIGLSGDGNTAVIGDPQFESGKGCFYVYNRNGNTWTEQLGQAQPQGLVTYSDFPEGVAVSYNGNVIAAGSDAAAQGQGGAYIFKRNGSTWSLTDSLPWAGVGEGYYIAMSSSGDTIMRGGQLLTEPIAEIYNGSAWQNVQYVEPAGIIGGAAGIVGSADMKLVLFAGSGNNGGVYTFGLGYPNIMGTQNINATCAQRPNGTLGIALNGGTPPYNVLWSNGATTDTITNLAPGTYGVTVSDALNDTVFELYTIAAVESITVSSIYTNLSCTGGNGAIGIVPAGGLGGYTYAWNTVPVQNTDSAVNLSNGTYVVSITDSVGCSLADTITLTPNSYWTSTTTTPVNCANNGTATITLYGGIPPYTYSWSNGDATATADSLGANTYTVTVNDGNNCSSTGSATLSYNCDNVIIGRVFYDRNNNCAQDSGEPGAAFYTLSASNGSYTVYGSTDTAGNYEIFTPTAGIFTVLIPVWGECAYRVCSAGAYPLTITFAATGDTAANENFPLLDTRIDLDLEAQSGVVNPGDTFTYVLYYGNLKDSVLPTAQLSLNYDPELSVLITAPAYSSIDTSAHNISWNLTNVGAFQTHSQMVSVTFVVSTSASRGTGLAVNSSIQPAAGDCNPLNNYLSAPIYVQASFDPNHKYANPSGIFYTTDSILEYTIFFQNTGSDSTHKVVIVDTLSSNVYPASVQTVATSHYPYSFNISGGGILTWTFLPYALPDSTVDKTSSSGFVTYQVRVKPGLAPGTIINNTASIYFDYNAPIITNTEQNIVTTPLGIAAVKPSGSVEVYPNPSNGSWQLALSNDLIGSPVNVYNTSGQLVFESVIKNQKSEINIPDIATGIYELRIISWQGIVVKKLVKM